jgi:hypothetical protein
MLGHQDPWCPRSNEEEASNLKSAGRTPRQNNGLECVKRHPEAAQQSANKCCDVHEKSLSVRNSNLFQPYQTGADLSKPAASIEETGYDHSKGQEFPVRPVSNVSAQLSWNYGVKFSTGETSSVEKRRIFIRQRRFFGPKLTLLDAFAVARR